MNKTRRVVTYERVSSDNQRERATILTQYEELERRLATEPDVEVVERYVDDGVSGMIELGDRPSGGRLLRDAAAHLFDEVWVYKLDRLGRDDIDPLVVRRDLAKLGIKVISLRENVESPLAYGIHVLLAAEERRAFLERSADGMNRAARAGRYTGGIAPLGYRVEGAKERARLVPSDTIMWSDQTEKQIVQRIYHLVGVDGRSCRDVANLYNQLGIATAYQKDARSVRHKATQGLWRPGRIRNLIVNPIYRGELQYGRRSTLAPGREVISARIEPLVTDELWYAAQETLARNRIMAKNATHSYMLRSVIRCGLCGLNYCGTTGRGQVWYRCDGQLVERGPIEGKCPGKSISGAQIEPLVWADIERFLRNPGDLLDALSAEAGDDGPAAVVEAEFITLTQALHDLDDKRDIAIELRLNKKIPEALLDGKLDQIAAERAEIERHLAQLHRPERDVPPLPLPDELLQQLRERLDSDLPDDARQEVVRHLVKRITVHTEFDAAGKKRVRLAVEYRFPAVGSSDTGRGSWRRSSRSSQGT